MELQRQELFESHSQAVNVNHFALESEVSREVLLQELLLVVRGRQLSQFFAVLCDLVNVVGGKLVVYNFKCHLD